MCGRFAVSLPADAMAQLFEAAPANDLPEIPNYNVCPTNRVHGVVQDKGRRLIALRWGFLPTWYKAPNGGPLLINARAETIAEKPAFRAASRARRCLIPASGFYEWTKSPTGARLPWYIHPVGPEPLVFAGVWQDWQAPGSADVLRCCALVTTAANAALTHIHHRMPVVLHQDDWGLWLGEQGKGAAALMVPAPDDLLTAYRVDPAVNSNRTSGPGLLAPLESH